MTEDQLDPAKEMSLIDRISNYHEWDFFEKDGDGYVASGIEREFGGFVPCKEIGIKKVEQILSHFLGGIESPFLLSGFC